MLIALIILFIFQFVALIYISALASAVLRLRKDVNSLGELRRLPGDQSNSAWQRLVGSQFNLKRYTEGGATSKKTE